MNPIGLYNDPALDNLVFQTSRTHRSEPTQGRNGTVVQRSVSDGYNMDHQKRPQYTQEMNKITPISYRGVGPDADPALHRSFSQRAKHRPFADEAFREDSPVHQNADEQLPTPSSRDAVPQESPYPIPTPQRKSSGTTHPDISDRRATQGPHDARARDNRVSLGAPINHTRKRSHGTRDVRAVSGNADSTVARSVSLKDAANQTDDAHSKWASDRSPLQKLEVKLTDISKEEKRARMQEAEMQLMQERKLGKAPSRPQRTSTQESSSTSRRTAAQRESRSSADQSRQSQPELTTSRSQARDSRGGVASDRTSYGNDRASRSVQQPSKVSAPKRIPQGTVLNPTEEGKRPAYSELDHEHPRNPMTVYEQPHSGKTVSLSKSQPYSEPRDNEHLVSARERNASHQAALDQLVGLKPVQAMAPSSNSQRRRKALSKDENQAQNRNGGPRESSPVPMDLSSFAAGGPLADLATSNSTTMRETSLPRSPTLQQRNLPPAADLGVQQPKALHSVDSPPVSLTDVGKHRQRKSSVSFRERFDRRRPVDEWKDAGVACLSLDDFSNDKTETTKTSAAWWEKGSGGTKRSSSTRAMSGKSMPASPINNRTAQYDPKLHVKCGPLLRYAGLRRTRNNATTEGLEREFWRGSIMIVTQDSACSYTDIPTLRLFACPRKLLPPPPVLVQGDQLAPEYVDPIAGLMKVGRDGKARYVRPVDHLEQAKDLSRVEDDTGIYESSPSPLDQHAKDETTYNLTNDRTLSQNGEELGRYKEIKGVRLYADPDRDVTFWRFNIEVELGLEQQHIAYRINKGVAMGFWVPARGQTMNIMFHSCNGFSMSVETDKFSGPDPLWRDVLNNHQTRPFHVMIGGGDQIYNDRVMTETHLFAEWTKIRNPHHKHQALFTTEMKEELESFYLERYSMWFSQGLFAMANASIPMVNIWDDHDIIDGFGSYPHDFMKSPVFSGLGGVAFKYYMLFQHQSVDAMTDKEEPSWIQGHALGPYIQSKSRSLFLELGRSVAFLGIDCRTERRRDEIVSEDTLELLLERCRQELTEGRTKHLIVLLGVPIAYPRLVWLENVLTSRAMDPIKAMGRAGLLKTGFLNKFDGGVEILDDLDDHWTASHHKAERNDLIQDLQDLAAERSARITILGGDVHLAAVGQFYSNPKLKIPKDKDHRYMPNIVSSAIVNTPPPDIMADVLNKRNKVHHLDKYTDENMIPMFTHDVNDKKRNNVHLLPRRNWCSIREYDPGQTPPSTPSLESFVTEGEESPPASDHEQDYTTSGPPQRRPSFSAADFNPRNLIRRLSSRGAPPSAFPSNGSHTNGAPTTRAVSLDAGARPHTAQPTGPDSPMRTASLNDVADVPSLRPTFLRRPTNLSEKAARKGNVPALDAEGNEFDVNDHVNLEGGLDITLNCEVDQTDPSGITTPYRILIPALWYDGSSDREKLEVNQNVGRADSVLKRFGLGSSRSSKVAANQGAGNWGKDSDSGSQEFYKDHTPRRTFSLFGSRKKRHVVHDIDSKTIGHPQPIAPNGSAAKNEKSFLNSKDSLSYDDGDGDEDDDDSEERVQPTREPAKPHLQGANTLYDRGSNLEHGSAALNTHQSRTSARPSQAQQQQVSYQPPQPVIQSELQQQSRGTAHVPRPSQPSTVSVQRDPSTASRHSRRGSYVIGGSDVLNVASRDSRQPYDADASYVEHQARSEASPALNIPQRTHSKQDRVLGIATTSSNYQNPQQTQLRGNGILGKNLPAAPPSSFHERTNSGANSSNRPQSSSGSALNRGYSGIEAYKDPKPKRRWSLRDKARSLIDSVEGRRRSDREDMYRDDEEADRWEGGNSTTRPRRDQDQDFDDQYDDDGDDIHKNGGHDVIDQYRRQGHQRQLSYDEYEQQQQKQQPQQYRADFGQGQRQSQRRPVGQY